ncbi:proteoglycan 4-like isoform X2 [Branchiostoma lanceolatum]|uniref:proteoglycan 4-like isoform X2 n=1 Tax=Branchiostoma lanceolatum TaxID=7740 RepID=UPI003453448F
MLRRLLKSDPGQTVDAISVDPRMRRFVTSGREPTEATIRPAKVVLPRLKATWRTNKEARETISVMLTAHFGHKGYHFRKAELRPAFWPEQLQWKPPYLMPEWYKENTTPKDRNWTRDGLVPIIEAGYRYYGYDPNVHIEAAQTSDTPSTATGADPDTMEEGLSRPAAPTDRNSDTPSTATGADPDTMEEGLSRPAAPTDRNSDTPSTATGADPDTMEEGLSRPAAPTDRNSDTPSTATGADPDTMEEGLSRPAAPTDRNSDTPSTATGADPDTMEEGLSRPAAPTDRNSDTPSTATGADPDTMEEGLSRPIAPTDRNSLSPSPSPSPIRGPSASRRPSPRTSTPTSPGMQPPLGSIISEDRSLGGWVPSTAVVAKRMAFTPCPEAEDTTPPTKRRQLPYQEPNETVLWDGAATKTSVRTPEYKPVSSIAARKKEKKSRSKRTRAGRIVKKKKNYTPSIA